jgi:hypothetical protein
MNLFKPVKLIMLHLETFLRYIADGYSECVIMLWHKVPSWPCAVFLFYPPIFYPVNLNRPLVTFL